MDKTPIKEAIFKDNDTHVDLTALGHAIPGYASPELITVDMQPILRICNLARISILRVSAFEESNEDELKITGIGQGGTATGSASTTPKPNKTRKQSTVPLDPEWIKVLRGIDFTSHEIILNVNELKRFISEKGGNLRDPNIWANFINKYLTNELAKITYEKLKLDNKKLLEETLYPLVYMNQVIKFVSQNDLVSALLSTGVAFSYAIWIAIISEYFFRLLLIPKESLQIVLYIIFMFSDHILKEHFFKPLILKSEADRNKVHVKYDPPSVLCLGDFELGRIMEIRALLKNPLITVSNATS